MFSIINTGLVKALVWFSPGSRAVSTIAPRGAQPARDPSPPTEYSPLPPRAQPIASDRASARWEAGRSQTRSSSQLCESSHTQEFVNV
jgi:hypothetical protein